MTNTKEYKYYKIIRDDGMTTTCTVLNWLEGYFKQLFGVPETWVESDEKVIITCRKFEMELPMKVEATTKDYNFQIVLSEQEYINVELKYW